MTKLWITPKSVEQGQNKAVSLFCAVEFCRCKSEAWVHIPNMAWRTLPPSVVAQGRKVENASFSQAVLPGLLPLVMGAAILAEANKQL
jgi:hypothetical protein